MRHDLDWKLFAKLSQRLFGTSLSPSKGNSKGRWQSNKAWSVEAQELRINFGRCNWISLKRVVTYIFSSNGISKLCAQFYYTITSLLLMKNNLFSWDMGASNMMNTLCPPFWHHFTWEMSRILVWNFFRSNMTREETAVITGLLLLSRPPLYKLNFNLAWILIRTLKVSRLLSKKYRAALYLP